MDDEPFMDDIVARTKATCEDDVVDVGRGGRGAGVVFAKRSYFRKMSA
jgi:hypothetical protein